MNSVRAAVGDLVEFDLPGHSELKLSLLVWGLPMVGLLAGAVAGASTDGLLGISRDACGLFGALGGFVLFLLPAWLYDRKHAGSEVLTPVTVRVVHGPMACNPKKDSEPKT